MNKRLFYRVGGAVFMSGAMLSFAHAQVTPPPLPTSVPGVKILDLPPAGFNPLTASAAARRQYAIPPAPDATAAPNAYNEWLRAVTGPQNRSVAPVLQQTQIFNGPAKKAGPSVPQENNVNGAPGAPSNSIIQANSYNWSGPTFYSSSNPFAVAAIIGEYVVPTARQAFGKCDGGWDYSSLWPGIDGWGSGDVLQAGVEVDAYCNGSTTASFYSAWVEWYPFSETRVSSPAIQPGDVVFVEVWNASSTVGYAYFYNFSTQTAAVYQLTAPSGTTLKGSSAEWIAERPSVGGGLATLTNYIDSSWPYNVAWNYNANNPTFYYPGFSPIGTLYLVTMLDNASNPISYGAPQNFDFIYFTDFGSAFGNGTPPYTLAKTGEAGGNTGSR